MTCVFPSLSACKTASTTRPGTVDTNAAFNPTYLDDAQRLASVPLDC